jgi:SAM-dependent methyltransferase
MILSGLATFVPGLIDRGQKGTGGSVSARYCYSVWLRHLVMARRAGMTQCPEVVAELGPGDSLGTGLAALLSGARRYFALDVVEHANVTLNLAVFDELAGLFRAREDIPGESEYPGVKPYLDDYSFPLDLIGEEVLAEALEPGRLAGIRDCLKSLDGKGAGKSDAPVVYQVPWYDSAVLQRETVDMVFSQAVMEYVEDLPHAYQAIHAWLKPGGVSSHQIDYKCDRTADRWNGHWAHSRLVWYLANRKRLTHVNRKAHSEHIQEQLASGFRINCQKLIENTSGLQREELRPGFRHLPDGDLVTSGAYILSMKPG